MNPGDRVRVLYKRGNKIISGITGTFDHYCDEDSAARFHVYLDEEFDFDTGYWVSDVVCDRVSLRLLSEEEEVQELEEMFNAH